MKSGAVQIGDISVDTTTGQLTDNVGGQVQLRNKSKAVLLYLLERPNEVVTKAEIMDSVWSDVTVSDESLVQCIADIRKLIGSDARRIIETVPRVGYRLNIEPVQPRGRGARLALAVGVVAAAVFSVTWILEGRNSDVIEETEPKTIVDATSSPPGTMSTEAYLEVLQGRVSAGRFGQDESLNAERHFRRAISLDPNYARAYAELGTLLAVRFENDWNVLEQADAAKALYYAEKAAELDPDLWLAHYALGRLQSVLENFEDAERHLEIAMSLQPENEDARAYFAVVKNLQGYPAEAIDILEPVVRAHPNPPFWYYFALGHAFFNEQRYEEAEQTLSQCLELAGNSPYCLRYLIATYGELSRPDAAAAAARDYASLGFELAIDPMVELVRFHAPSDKARLRAGLRRAGIPE